MYKCGSSILLSRKTKKETIKSLFAIRRSRIDGHVLFTSMPISQGRKIGEMSGERISKSDARRRARTLQRIAIVELNDGTAIDGSRHGNQFRFINHSCSPNTFMRIYRAHVEFYALRDIEKGEELTCNYGRSHHNGRLPCRCGSTRCQGNI
jgi:SET domain-containing protein